MDASNPLCSPVGGIDFSVTHLRTNSTSCAHPTGDEYYPVPSSPAYRGQRIKVVDSFSQAHDLFNLTNPNVSDPESVIFDSCAARCDALGVKCSSFFVNLGIPDPPLPSGESQASRWYCHGYDAPLRPTDFTLAPLPNTYIRPMAFGRACNVTDNSTSAPRAPSSTSTPVPFSGRAAYVQTGWFASIVGALTTVSVLAWL